MPLYVRAGAIVPMGPVQQYATEQPDAPYEVRVYAGADGRFTLYEDDNETYAYEKGQAARYDLRWDDARRTLAIGARRGSFPGLVERRRLTVVLIGAGGASHQRRSVTYDGRATSVRFASS
jgi:alpha-D-xyloside xylohydrolase